jgi:UDP-N-acetylmuramyl tripeptide synthase
MGKIAHDRSDIVFVTSDNPRTESPSGICDDVVSGFEDELYSQPKLAALNLAFLKDMNRFNEFWHRDILELQEYTKRYVVEDRYTAIRAAINMASEQDAVVIAGKGHEDFIEVGNNYYWFDDRAEARHTLETQRQMYERQNGEPVTDFSRLPWRQYPQSNRVSLLDLVKDVSKSEHSSAAR